jgi:hypothetical protein
VCGGLGVMFCAVLGAVFVTVMARGTVVDGADEHAEDDEGENNCSNAGMIEEWVAS